VAHLGAPPVAAALVPAREPRDNAHADNWLPWTMIDADPMALLRLAMNESLHPQRSLHPSWLPPDWPVRRREAWGGAQAGRLMAQQLRRRGLAEDPPSLAAETPLQRLSLIDAPSLRRLAWYCGFCAHRPLLLQRGAMAAQIRRQLARLDDGAVDFVLDRVPPLTELRFDVTALVQRPIAAGAVITQRGHRLLLGALAPEGPLALQRVQRKLPRRAASLRVPQLAPRQLDQLRELMLACIVPERLPQWDWLF
jgi:type III secretion protein K